MSISEVIPAVSTAGRTFRRHSPPPLVPALPDISVGQLWLVELAGEEPLPALARHVLRNANVVIYDRTLVEDVAAALPLGGYAEPASGAEPTAARCVRFAQDGWSVARLLPARLASRERTRRVQDLVDELAVAKVSGRLPVQVFAEAADGIEEHLSARFDDLAAIVARFPRETRLTIVIDAFGGAAAARLHAVAANGLAG